MIEAKSVEQELAAYLNKIGYKVTHKTTVGDLVRLMRGGNMNRKRRRAVASDFLRSWKRENRE